MIGKHNNGLAIGNSNGKINIPVSTSQHEAMLCDQLDRSATGNSDGKTNIPVSLSQLDVMLCDQLGKSATGNSGAKTNIPVSSSQLDVLPCDQPDRVATNNSDGKTHRTYVQGQVTRVYGEQLNADMEGYARPSLDLTCCASNLVVKKHPTLGGTPCITHPFPTSPTMSPPTQVNRNTHTHTHSLTET